ncbi:MAG: molybdopterin-synthase adenylyltransferase MoeB [Gammaproteobacteria bacterium]|nr:molybdopterin-synthase adenylyltransferase MoeB [Gammaproteobacteria bacterium]
MNEQQADRYSRQIRLTQIGEAGQQKLLDATVLIIGMGGLGSPAAMYLTAGGVGKLIIADYDVVEASNLQRQIIHVDAAIGDNKVDSAARAIKALNPDCNVEAINYQVDGDELRALIERVDIVLDCCDNFPSRFETNRYCVETATPLVSGAAIRMEGQLMSYQPGMQGPCYQCLYSHDYENAETCELEGVLAPVVGVIGTMQALQAMMILTGLGERLVGKLLLFDANAMEWNQVKLPKSPACPVCSGKA